MVVFKENAGATDAELREWVKQRLRSSRVPTAIRFADQLPYNEMGKVLRRVIKQQLADLGSLGQATSAPDGARGSRAGPGCRDAKHTAL